MICPCSCTGPDCCECCIWDAATTELERRERKIIERQQQLENMTPEQRAAKAKEYKERLS